MLILRIEKLSSPKRRGKDKNTYYCVSNLIPPLGGIVPQSVFLLGFRLKCVPCLSCSRKPTPACSRLTIRFSVHFSFCVAIKKKTEQVESFNLSITTDNMCYVIIEFNKSLNYIYLLANKKCLLYYQIYKRAFV